MYLLVRSSGGAFPPFLHPLARLIVPGYATKASEKPSKKSYPFWKIFPGVKAGADRGRVACGIMGVCTPPHPGGCLPFPIQFYRLSRFLFLCRQFMQNKVCFISLYLIAYIVRWGKVREVLRSRFPALIASQPVFTYGDDFINDKTIRVIAVAWFVIMYWLPANVTG